MANGFQAPTDYSTEQADIERRRKYAEALQAQSMQPMGGTETVGGWAIKRSPMEGLAQALKGYMGAKGIQDADARSKALGERYTADRSADMARILRAGAGTPESNPIINNESPNGAPESTGPTSINIPAEPGGYKAQLAAYLSSPFADRQTIGQTAQLKSMEPHVVGPGASLVEGGTPTYTAPFKPAPLHFATTPNGVLPLDANTGKPAGPEISVPKEAWTEPYDLNGAMVQKNSITGQVRQAVNREPQIHNYNPPAVTVTQVIDPKDPTRMLNVDARTYKQGGTLGDAGVLGVSGKLGDSQKLTNKREFNMSGLGATIQEAKDLLTGTKGGVAGAGDKPTASGIGAAVDYAGSLIGASPKGSVPAAQLKAIGGSLVSKMPRMEGPQSDKDVMLYKEMAGKVGDPTVPVDQRTAALDVIEKLWGKYEKPAAPAGASGGWAVVR